MLFFFYDLRLKTFFRRPSVNCYKSKFGCNKNNIVNVGYFLLSIEFIVL